MANCPVCKSNNVQFNEGLQAIPPYQIGSSDGFSCNDCKSEFDKGMNVEFIGPSFFRCPGCKRFMLLKNATEIIDQKKFLFWKTTNVIQVCRSCKIIHSKSQNREGINGK